MKKIRKVMILSLFMSIFLLTGCFSKKPIGPDQFKNAMEKKGFVITDATNQFASYSFVKKVYVASEKSYKYQIEYFEFASDTNAKAAFNSNKANFESFKDSISKENIKIETNDYSKYQNISNGKYMLTIRAKNIVLFVNASDKYSSEIKSIIKGLGY
ncbi:MAG: hypothetical protein IJ094_03025 [Bacilli bacterium]|nr:hypothetical protein [Bacilli bacterium]